MRDAVAAGLGAGVSRALLAAALAGSLIGCATKGDLVRLRTQVVALQERQDSLFRLLEQQNALLLDTLRASFDLQRNVRGQFSYQVAQLNDQLISIQELLGQTQQRLTDLRQQSEQMRQQSAIQTPFGNPPAGGVSGDATAEEIYNSGMEKLQQGSIATARAAFQALLHDYPNDPRAADAQYQLAETYYQEKDYDQALAALEEIPKQWPNHVRAPAALYRAGVIAEEQGKKTKAREYYQQVRQRYPDSDEAKQAEARLKALK